MIRRCTACKLWGAIRSRDVATMPTLVLVTTEVATEDKAKGEIFYLQGSERSFIYREGGRRSIQIGQTITETVHVKSNHRTLT